MQQKVTSFAMLLAIALLLSHCTIQKRSFNRGYHVEWHHKTTSGANTFVHPIVGSETQNRHAKISDSFTLALDKTSIIPDSNRISLASPIQNESTCR